MAEQINIQVITSSLRKLAKSWAEANRRAQMNKERRQRVEAEAKRLRKPVEQAKPWPGAVPESERRDELAAFRGDKPGIAVAFSGTSIDGTSFTVYSGFQNQSASAAREVLLGMGPRYGNFNGIFWNDGYRRIAGGMAQRFLLPINGESAILVDWVREQRRIEHTVYSGPLVLSPLTFPVLVSTDTEPEELFESIHCFVVNRRAVREISVPAAFKAALDLAAPLATYVPPPPLPTDVDWYTGKTNDQIYTTGYYMWPAGPPFEPSLHFAVRLRLDGWLPGLTSDAGIYKCLSDWDNAPRVGHAGTTVLNLRSLLLAFLGAEPVPDQSFGYGKLAGTVTAERIGYDRNTSPDVFLSVWNRYPKTDIATVFNGTSVPVGLYSTWDWGEPRYCRQQLLALGFTPADLKP